jgi:hypothetical protein
MYLRIQKRERERERERDNDGRQFGTEIDVLSKVSRWSILRLLGADF